MGFTPWKNDNEHFGVPPEESKLKRGIQIVYVPDHAGQDVDHLDSEPGFIVSVQDRWSAFCRYWLKPNLTELRTKVNSEFTPLDRIFIHNTVPQKQVEEALKNIGEVEC